MTKQIKHKSIVLPALRGVMGDWVYYSALMSTEEVGLRVSYADEIHKNENLSEMIQRKLKAGRAKEIANYIQEQPERFFNSIVVATYDGEPNWFAVSGVKPSDDSISAEDFTEETLNSVGFLKFRGDEKLFAIDGQHRLAGIKRACADGLKQDQIDELSVIFVAHKKSKSGLERTRRLFTTLNKTAKPVVKGDIIALDEDDVMAICARRLIEETDYFGGSRIAFVATNNMPSGNFESITTIGNLYDILLTIFTKFPSKLKESKRNLRNIRPGEERLEEFFNFALCFFKDLGKNFPEVNEFYQSTKAEDVVRKYRGQHGGSVLFRPIGIQILVDVIARLTAKHDLSKAMQIASKLPRNLNEAPYLGLMWDSSNRTISNSHKVTLREVLCHMVECSKYSEGKLTERYRKEISQEDAVLPEKVI